MGRKAATEALQLSAGAMRVTSCPDVVKRKSWAGVNHGGSGKNPECACEELGGPVAVRVILLGVSIPIVSPPRLQWIRGPDEMRVAIA